MVTDPGHISWRMPISSSTPPRAKSPIETPSRIWTPFVQSKLSFEQQSPILPIPSSRNDPGLPAASATLPSSIAPHISASTSDEALRSSLSAARAELNNSTFQIDHLRKLVLDLEQENSRLKSDNSYRRVGSSTTPEDVSKVSSSLDNELHRVQDELHHCEQKYHEALAHHRLQTISLEADRDAKARELHRVQQELEEITVLYKGKTRCLQQLQELHEAQSVKDGSNRSEDRRRIEALSSHITKLRDALLNLRQVYEAEKTKCADQQNRLKTMKTALDEANIKFETCNSELLSAREEIDELLSQLSELDNKRRQSGGHCIRQPSGYQSDAVKSVLSTKPARSSTPSDSTPSVNNIETLPPSLPSDQPVLSANQPQRVVACKDASTCTEQDPIPELMHPDALQKKLLNTEALLSTERATSCKLRAEILDMEERELESEKLCDMLQAEIEKLKKTSDAGQDISQSVLADIKKSYPVTIAEKSEIEGSKLLELCMDECNELRRQNAELAIELDRVRSEVRRKDGELHKLRVRLSQRPVPLHNPLTYDFSNDATTVNESATQISSVS